MTDLIFCLMGPTASGKTHIACELVKKFPFEIISVDSALVYRGMDIGTAKPESDVLQEAPHHLIDILDPPERYSAADFCADVNRLCHEIKARNKLPLLVGGTMMYFNALQQGLAELPKADEKLREKLLEEGKIKGWPALHSRLATVDEVSASRIHPHDAQRIQRALEVYELTGKRLSDFLQQTNKNQLGQFINLKLMPTQRAWLHERIAKRFHEMVQQGVIEEVKQLLHKWPLTEQDPAMRAVGYRQAYLYLSNQISYDEFVEKGIAATRQLAKRQLTWLRQWPDGYTFEAEKTDLLGEIMAVVEKLL